MTSIRTCVTLVLLALTLSLATSVAAQPLSGPEFIPLATPCRALDTRVTGTPLQANVPRTIQIGGVTTGGANCGVPTTAAGAALNFTVTQPQGPGHMAAWPSGALPQTAAVNFGAGEDVGNAIDIGLGAGGTVIVQSIVTTHLVVDVYGYFTDVEELGNGNTALGDDALASNTTGANNTALGASALASNTTGNSNTATGALTPSRSNTTGSRQHRHGGRRPRQQHHGRQQHRHGASAPSTATPRAAQQHRPRGRRPRPQHHGQLQHRPGTARPRDATTPRAATTSPSGQRRGNVTTGSNNIHIGNQGTTDTALIRIGTVGTHTTTFIAGIFGAHGARRGAAG